MASTGFYLREHFSGVFKTHLFSQDRVLAVEMIFDLGGFLLSAATHLGLL